MLHYLPNFAQAQVETWAINALIVFVIVGAASPTCLIIMAVVRSLFDRRRK
jgi:hypothetical protein